MRALIARVLSGCWFKHDKDPLFARDARGRAVWECRRCGQPIPQRTEQGARVPFRTVGAVAIAVIPSQRRSAR